MKSANHKPTHAFLFFLNSTNLCDCRVYGIPQVNPWSLFVPVFAFGFAVVSANFPGRHRAAALLKRIHPRVNPWFSAKADKPESMNGDQHAA